jgi:hypothetical protein
MLLSNPYESFASAASRLGTVPQAAQDRTGPPVPSSLRHVSMTPEDALALQRMVGPRRGRRLVAGPHQLPDASVTVQRTAGNTTPASESLEDQIVRVLSVKVPELAGVKCKDDAAPQDRPVEAGVTGR